MKMRQWYTMSGKLKREYSDAYLLVIRAYTKKEIQQVKIFLRMCEDYNKLGIPFEKAVSQVLSLLNSQKKGW